MMNRYAIYTDAEPGRVNYDSFDGTYTFAEVADRTDDHGRMLRGAASSLNMSAAALGVFLENGLYIERHRPHGE